MLRRILITAAVLPFLALTGCEQSVVKPVGEPAFHHGRGGHAPGGPGGGGPIPMVVQVSSGDFAIQGDGGEYPHGGCIEAIQDGPKLLQFASALDRSDCNSGEWRGLLFPEEVFAGSEDRQMNGVGELPAVNGMLKGAVLNLNVFDNGTFNLWIRAVSTDGTLLDFSKWSVSYGTVETHEEDGWTLVRLTGADASAGVGERYEEPHRNPRRDPRRLWADAGTHHLPIELRFRPLE